MAKITLKGQTSMELLTGIGFLLFILLIFILFANEKLRESNELKSWIDAKRICKRVVMNINTISEQGNSYYKTFKLPKKIYKNFNYTIQTYSNRVEISWDSRLSPISLPIVTGNVTIYCLDKGEEKKNKILNKNGSILITCYRPDLTLLKETFSPRKVNIGETVNLSIKIKNDGLVKAEDFIVFFNFEEIHINLLDVDETKTLKVQYTAPLTEGNYTIPIILDYGNIIEESIEEDNEYNATISVT